MQIARASNKTIRYCEQDRQTTTPSIGAELDANINSESIPHRVSLLTSVVRLFDSPLVR